MPLDGAVWAFGCLVYKMMQGYAPFRNVNDICHTDRESSLSSKLSVTCKSFIRLCLKKDQEKRLQYEKINIHPWVRL